MKIFSIKTNNIIYLMQDVIIYTVIIIAFECFLYYYLSGSDKELFFFLSFLILLVYLGAILLPALILYSNYRKYNKNTVLTIEKENIKINGINIEISAIKEIVITATYQHFSEHKGATSLPYNDYFYYIDICLKENENFYLTSLLGYELDKELKKQFPILHFRNQIKSFPKIK